MSCELHLHVFLGIIDKVEMEVDNRLILSAEKTLENNTMRRCI